MPPANFSVKSEGEMVVNGSLQNGGELRVRSGGFIAKFKPGLAGHIFSWKITFKKHYPLGGRIKLFAPLSEMEEKDELDLEVPTQRPNPDIPSQLVTQGPVPQILAQPRLEPVVVNGRLLSPAESQKTQGEGFLQSVLIHGVKGHSSGEQQGALSLDQSSAFLREAKKPSPASTSIVCFRFVQKRRLRYEGFAQLKGVSLNQCRFGDF